MDIGQLRVRDMGEQGILQRLLPFCDADVVGDDGAVVAVDGARQLVVTTDLLVDGVHFSVGVALPEQVTMGYADVGWRAIAANLSDLAAMAAKPLGITVGLGLPGELWVTDVEDLYRGMVSCLSQFGDIPIIGGDVCRSPVLSVNITAFGQVLLERVVRRSLARPGDAIVVTGVHGAAKAGLELLLQPELGLGLDAVGRRSLHLAHQRPMPRLDVVDQLPLGRVAGMDSSDGLADAVLQICRASGVGAVLFREQILLSEVVCDWVGRERALEWALYGGEDFELVLCLGWEDAVGLVARVGGKVVGRVVAGAGVVVRSGAWGVGEGEGDGEILDLGRGFQHY